MVKDKMNAGVGLGLPIEPFTTFFPEVGPNTHLFLRKVRGVFDPNSVAAPGRQVFSEEECKHIPEPVSQLFNSMREKVGLEALSTEP